MRGNSILFQLYTEDLDEILRFFFYAEYKDSEIKSFQKIHTDIRVGKNFSQLFLGIQKKKKKLESTYYACNIVSSFFAFNHFAFNFSCCRIEPINVALFVWLKS